MTCSIVLSAFAADDTVRFSSWTISGTQAAQEATAFPIVIQTESPASTGDGIALTSTFSLPATWDANLGIIFFKNLFSCKIYVNDVYIDTLGRKNPDFFFQPYLTRGVLVSSSILKPNNTIRLELWNDTGTYNFRMLRCVNQDTYTSLMNRYNFFDSQIPRLACIVLFFIAIYSFSLFLNYRKNHDVLEISLASLFFGIYLLNVTVFDSKIPYVKMKAILYSCFPLSMLVLFRFFNSFFEMHTKKLVRIILTVIGLVFAAGYYFMPNTAILDKWHSLMLIYPICAIVYGAIGLLKAFRERRLQMLPIGLGLIIASLFSVYDMYFFFTNQTPFILLQGPGFMCLLIGTFIGFSQNIADTNRRCVLLSEELQKAGSKRESVFKNVKSATEKANDSGSKLDQSIESISTLVTKYLTSIEQVNSNIEIQHTQVEENKQHVDKIFYAINETSAMVSQHEGLVQETVKNVSELTTGLHKTDILIHETSETLENLTEACTAADKDVTESLRYIDDLSSYSKNINEIANSISDLSQQTNVLSINAAIEAARSGQAGKGFSVVAEEVRNLATRSGDSAENINRILQTMANKIITIQKQEDLVSARLKTIIAENKRTSDSMQDVFSGIDRQLTQNESITHTVQELVSTVQIISTQTAKEQQSGESLRTSLQMLEKITGSIVNASREQKACYDELMDDILRIRTVSENNMALITDLKQAFAE